MITNDYRRTPATHAAHNRSTGDSFARMCERRATAMPIEANELEARLKNGEIEKKYHPYTRQRIEDLRSRADGVRKMGLNFQKVFHESANRIEAESKAAQAIFQS